MLIKFFLNEDIKNAIDKSTIHGLPNAVRTESLVMRIFWLISFFISFGYCSHLLVLSVLEFLQFNVIYEIRIINDNFNMEFPSVTFCNLVPIDFSRKEIKYILENSSNLNESSYKDDANWLSTIRKKFETDLYKKEKLYPNGFIIEKMLLSCIFNSKSCNSSHFEYVASATYGNCFKFDSSLVNESMEVFRAGFEFGLKLELFIGSEEENPYWIRETGALISIQNKSTKPVFGEEGLKVKPNTETSLKVYRETFKKLSRPYSDCIEKNDSPDSFDSFNYKDAFFNSSLYRQKVCMNRCGNKKNRQTQNKSYKEDYMSCLEACPLECTSTRFLITPNFASYPIDNYAKLLKSTKTVLKNMTLSEIKKSVLAVNVVYDSMSFTMIDEKPALTFETLLANIGG